MALWRPVSVWISTSTVGLPIINKMSIKRYQRAQWKVVEDVIYPESHKRSERES